MTWWAPSVKMKVIQDSMVAKRMSPLGLPAFSKSHLALVANWFGATRTPSGWSIKQSMTVRRSCQPSAGPTGSLVVASNMIVVARWLAMPTKSAGPASARVSWAQASARVAISSASNSTSPGFGVRIVNGFWCTALTRPAPSTMAARTEVVPTSMTSVVTTRRRPVP